MGESLPIADCDKERSSLNLIQRMIKVEPINEKTPYESTLRSKE